MDLNSSQIITIFSSILGSGFIVAVINGLFLLSKDDKSLRNTHLIEDKKELRNLLRALNDDKLLMFSLKPLTNKFILERVDQSYADEVIAHINRIYMYMDLNNPYTPKLHTAYFNLTINVSSLAINKVSSILVLAKQSPHFKSLPLPAEVTNQVNSIEDEDIDTIKKDLLSKCTNDIKNIKSLTGKYFSYYYPKPSFWSRFKCCKN